MAFFSKKKEETKAPAVPSSALQHPRKSAGEVVLRPRMSEKSMAGGERGVYTFVVSARTTKREIAAAIRDLYAVTPKKVRIVNRAPALRHIGSRNRSSKVPGMKKAYVYLKVGDTINLV